MALIGKAKDLDWFFLTFSALQEVQAYILDALNPTHSIHKRILALSIKPNEQRCEISYPLEQGIRAIEQSYYLKSVKEAFLETHRIYVDFQLIVAGYEYVCVGDRSTFCVKTPYDEAKDLIVYENDIESSTLDSILPNMRYKSKPKGISEYSTNRTLLRLEAGDLAIFFPDDVHAGALEPNLQPLQSPLNHAEQSILPISSATPHILPIKKSVLKVPLALFTP